MRVLIFCLLGVFLIVSLSDARNIRKKSFQDEGEDEDESEEDQMSKRDYETSVEITPGHTVFPDKGKQFETETKIFPPDSSGKLQDQQPVLCYIPGMAFPGYQLPYPYPYPIPQGYPNFGKKK